ncbi:hypothetical protein RJ640_008082 [Escallonia rubra]|uniref:Uncharacterized protein n=1 Tax=Escallonia rubra TaxID=112253 RepID=A0AA88QUH1_9ASTE|nr:hypothetical protein RJ640_008082 [Escallonia rubra]
MKLSQCIDDEDISVISYVLDIFNTRRKRRVAWEGKDQGLDRWVGGWTISEYCFLLPLKFLDCLFSSGQFSPIDGVLGMLQPSNIASALAHAMCNQVSPAMFYDQASIQSEGNQMAKRSNVQNIGHELSTRVWRAIEIPHVQL